MYRQVIVEERYLLAALRQLGYRAATTRLPAPQNRPSDHAGLSRCVPALAAPRGLVACPRAEWPAATAWLPTSPPARASRF